jgi:hypothetical protein
MRLLSSLLKESTISKLLEIANDVLAGNNSGYRAWTNLAWNQKIILDSTMILCVAIPDNIIDEVEDSLAEHNLIDYARDESLKRTKTVMLYIWPAGSYIPSHRDSTHGKAITVYLNKDWQTDDGGLFCWGDGPTYSCILPSYNTAVENSMSENHFTTPVNSKEKLRFSLQIFISKKANI